MSKPKKKTTRKQTLSQILRTIIDEAVKDLVGQAEGRKANLEEAMAEIGEKLEELDGYTDDVINAAEELQRLMKEAK